MVKFILFLFVLVVANTSCQADILFPKDTSVDFVFPPKVRRSSTGLPDGHLRPLVIGNGGDLFGFRTEQSKSIATHLGWQRPPEGKVNEVSEAPDPKTFWETHVKPKKPLVLREGVNKSADCFTKWDDKYLKSTFGQITVDVTTKKPGKRVEPQVMTLKKFLLRYNMEDWYLVNPVPSEMLYDIPAVASLMCGSFKKHLQEAEIWMSSGGTSSSLHYDPDHNMHCLVTGRKDFIMVDPKFKDRFEMKEDKDEGSGYSTIDMEMVNMYEHPKVGKTNWRWTTLWPGDCIFIPHGYLHQVRSYGRSLSITVLWTPMKEFNDTGCAEVNLNAHIPLSDLEFVWKLHEGERLINTDKYDDPEILRHHLVSLLRNDPKLTRERFFRYFEKARNNESRKKNQTPHAAFRQLDLKKKNYLSARDIQKLPRNLLERVAKLFIRPSEDEEEKLLKDEL